MLISLSILPITLLLLHSVHSADLYESKRVPRRHTEIRRSRHVFVPSILKDTEFIPVNVVYENIGAIRDDKTLHARSVNHPPSADEYFDDPHAIESEFEKDDVESKTEVEKRGRSLIAESRKNGTVTQRRRSHVRKVKVNKTQLQTELAKAEIPVTTVSPTPVAEDKPVDKAETIVEKAADDYPKLRVRSSQDGQVIETPVGPYISKRRNGLREPVVPIVESENYVFAHSGDFHYSYEGGDGTKAFERGELKNSNGGAGNAVEGSFSYKDKDGNDFSLTYTADENGYRPIGAHLPTPPPIPIAIQRALALLATKTTPEPVTETNKNSFL